MNSFLKPRFYIILLLGMMFTACSNNNPASTKDEDEVPPKEDPIVEADAVSTIDISQTNQTMIGFGGALTWNSVRIINSGKKDELIDIIASDLGMDILRLKNWYYPAGYPENKEPNQMVIGWHKPLFDATNELYDLITAIDPDVKVLFSSWGPINTIKSNERLFRGTLKKQNGEFMYDEFAAYWEDVLDHITFMPDYLSIQNEPTWVADWETCEWRPVETEEFPSYEIAFNMVAENLNKLENPPILVGPESANLSFDGFDAFALELQDNPNLGVYGYHPYNFNNDTPVSEMQAILSEMGQNFSDKPNMMTEYDGLEWMKTAQFINSTMREANTAAYIYWKLVWDENSEEAMIKIDENGNYELTKFYYLMKHYSKFVDEGYKRVNVTSDNSTLDQIAFISPDANRLTVISVNPSEADVTVEFSVNDRTVADANAYQSLENNLYETINGLTTDIFNLQGESVTTTVLELN